MPADAPLEVEANISGREDGYVHVGDPVAIKFDTFPFSQYGMAYGTVRIISPNSFTAQDEPRNPTGAVPMPPSEHRAVLPRAHRHRPVGTARRAGGFRMMPGMPVTADIKVGKRTVLGYLLRPDHAGRPGGNARAVTRTGCSETRG